MVLDSDYTVRSVRVVRPDVEVKNVRTASSGGIACSGHHSAYSADSATRMSGLSGGSPSPRATSGAYSSFCKSKGKSGGNEYFVKMSGSSGCNKLSQALSSMGHKSGFEDMRSSSPTSTIHSSAMRSRLSEVSSKQHEAAATIVTKVIREDTSEMELKINELTIVASELQHSLKSLIELSSNESTMVKEKMDSFVSVTSEMKDALLEITSQMSSLRNDVQIISHELKSCDERVVTIDRNIENKLCGFRQEITDRDIVIEQIKHEINNTDGLLANQSKQLRELEEHRHALYHAEENIKQKDDELSNLDQTLHVLTQKCHQMETETMQHSEVVVTLERDLGDERRARHNSEMEMSGMQQALATLERALDSEKHNKEGRERDLDQMQMTIKNLELTLEDDRRAFKCNDQDLANIQQAMSGLEMRLTEECRAKERSDKELANVNQLIDRITHEKDQLEQANSSVKQQSQHDLDSLTQMLEKLSVERTEVEEMGIRERRKSEQLQESMTSLRMILEEEQRKSEEGERRLQNSDRVIKEHQEMCAMKDSEFILLREEIVNYQNLVSTKEKELCNLTSVFNENMADNKNEVGGLRQEIKEYKTSLRELEFRLREYRDNETLQKAIHSSSMSASTTGAASSSTYHSHSLSHSAGTSLATASPSAGRLSPCRSTSPTLGYCQTHKSIVSLDSRASVGACGSTCGGNHGILSVRYADPCTKIYPSKDRTLQVTNIYQSSKTNRPIRLCDDHKN